VPPVGSKQKDDTRYFHIYEDEPIDEAQFIDWVKQASGAARRAHVSRQYEVMTRKEDDGPLNDRCELIDKGSRRWTTGAARRWPGCAS
jgi:hypothetical protein